MKNIALALLALVLLPATVFAGGGSKNSTELYFKNTSTTDIAFVIIDTTKTNAELAALTSPDAFFALGGFALNPNGGNKTVKVAAGNHSVKVVYVANMTPIVEANIVTKTVNAVANKKTNVNISGSVAAAPTVTVVP